MISEQMNRAMPSTAGSTRELRLALGGPWWWSSWASWAPTECAATAMGLRLRLRAGLGLDVLDGHVGGVTHALDELVRDPLRRALGQRRDEDLEDVEVLHGVHHRLVGMGIADHPGGDDPRIVEGGEQPPQALARLAHPVPLR